jgi:hypothetical protein
MILFSIPVHEEPEVIIDQIKNYRTFAPSCGIIIHPSKQFLLGNPELPHTLESYDGVIVNRRPILTAQHLVLKCHISNFLYAQTIGLDFTHFCHQSSNDLFVRPGVEDYVTRNDFGFQTIEAFKELFNFTHWREDFRKDKCFPKMVSGSMEPIRYLASQAEGTFYPTEAYKKFAEDFMRFAWKEFGVPYPYSHGSNLTLLKFFDRLQKNPRRRKYIGRFFYPKEEFYPPNYFIQQCNSATSPYCLMNWDKRLKVETEDVDMILSGKHPIPGYDEIFAVKRVERRLDDPLRRYIRGLA